MKGLILTCNTGEGHNSAGAAVMQELKKRGIPCERRDALTFLSQFISTQVGRWHARIYRHMPRAFSFGYRFAENHPCMFRRKSLISRLLTAGTERLYRVVRDGGYDMLICSHVFSAVLVSSLHRAHPELCFASCFIATDYTCYPIVQECDVDLFFMPDASLIDECVAKGVPRGRIVPSGIPVRMPFRQPIDRADARQKQNLPADAKHILLMCGSMGCGQIVSLAQALSVMLPQGAVLSIVCGTNKQLFRKLSGAFAGKEQIRVFGFVQDVATLFDSADLFVTKPGGLCITEAGARRLPMVLLDTVGGCESYNLRFFIGHGMAAMAKSDEVSDIAKFCIHMLENDIRRERIRHQMEKVFPADATKDICDHMFRVLISKQAAHNRKE